MKEFLLGALLFSVLWLSVLWGILVLQGDILNLKNQYNKDQIGNVKWQDYHQTEQQAVFVKSIMFHICIDEMRNADYCINEVFKIPERTIDNGEEKENDKEKIGEDQST